MRTPRKTCEVAAASFARWDEQLAVPSGHGYRRNDDGDAYG